jgi:putative hydrolase of the HAD superfamily
MGTPAVTTLPHVVWDMGGVMFRYFTELMLDLGTELGWPVEEIPLGPTGAVPDPDYDRMLTGEISELDYLPIVVDRLAKLGIEFDPPRDLRWHNQERPRTWETIDRIHQAGHRQAILTNDASRWLGKDWWDTWVHAHWFDAMIDVATLDHRKPRPQAYLAVAEALGTPPEDCLFVDDLPVNCAGAEATGMQSHLFAVTDPEASATRLELRLGLSPDGASPC